MARPPPMTHPYNERVSSDLIGHSTQVATWCRPRTLRSGAWTVYDGVSANGTVVAYGRSQIKTENTHQHHSGKIIEKQRKRLGK